MPTDRKGLPALFYPADVARVLGKSEWWVKEQARRGLIPFTKPGRAYRFTAEQVAEIVRLFESRPSPVADQPHPRKRPAQVVKPMAPAPSVRLRARPPRRAGAGKYANAA